MRSLDSLWRYAHAGHPVSPRDYRGLTASAFSLPWRSANALQGSCTGAIDALLKYGAGDISADDTLAALTTTMEDLAYQRAEVERVALPELDFEG